MYDTIKTTRLAAGITSAPIWGYAQDPVKLEKRLRQLDIRSHFMADLSVLKSQLLNTQRPPEAVVFELNQHTLDDLQALRYWMMQTPRLTGIPFVVISPYPSVRWRKVCRQLQVTDYILFPQGGPQLKARLSQMVVAPTTEAPLVVNWHLPRWKRAMDIAGAGTLLLLLSPVLACIALLIKLESRGPVVYVAKRAGQGFRMFDFIKFRSMRQDADQLVDQLKAQNQYTATPSATPPGVLRAKPVEGDCTVLFQDDSYVFEEELAQNTSTASTFFKVKNDPRITRIGAFLRNTSLDELPQLFNVLRGDMSLVGNRPLPLYEAEQLTDDVSVLRFAAPAGITGLWQVSKRGKGDMSEDERKQLDIQYALHYNFWMDITILWKTLPAAIQEEQV